MRWTLLTSFLLLFACAKNQTEMVAPSEVLVDYKEKHPLHDIHYNDINVTDTKIKYY